MMTATKIDFWNFLIIISNFYFYKKDFEKGMGIGH